MMSRCRNRLTTSLGDILSISKQTMPEERFASRGVWSLTCDIPASPCIEPRVTQILGRGFNNVLAPLPLGSLTLSNPFRYLRGQTT